MKKDDEEYLAKTLNAMLTTLDLLIIRVQKLERAVAPIVMQRIVLDEQQAALNEQITELNEKVNEVISANRLRRYED